MNKIRKVGILLIIIGFFIPSISYPFTSVTRQARLMQVAFANSGIFYDANHLRDLEVVLVEGVYKGSQNDGHFEGRHAVPYRYTIAFSITLVFIGISFFALYRKQKIPI